MKYNRYTNIATALFILGIVDQVHDGTAAVELSLTSEEAFINSHVDLPLWMFPCEISEGSQFYFTKTDEAFELRCGTPLK
jgi:hypothetical protein